MTRRIKYILRKLLRDIANHWWLFLIVLVLSLAVGFLNHLLGFSVFIIFTWVVLKWSEQILFFALLGLLLFLILAIVLNLDRVAIAITIYLFMVFVSTSLVLLINYLKYLYLNSQIAKRVDKKK